MGSAAWPTRHFRLRDRSWVALRGPRGISVAGPFMGSAAWPTRHFGCGTVPWVALRGSRGISIAMIDRLTL